jgi:hypothetical protein
MAFACTRCADSYNGTEGTPPEASFVVVCNGHRIIATQYSRVTLPTAHCAAGPVPSMVVSFPDKEHCMEPLESGISQARMPIGLLTDSAEQPRHVRWATFDRNTVPAPSARYCWLDRDTGRLVFSDSKDRPAP